MVDIPGDTSTTATLTVGGSITDQLETVGDHDWFRITLTAGQAVVVTINGVTLSDPYLYIRDASGNQLYSNDDINPGVNTNSRVAFSPTYSGTYYIDVGAYADQSAGSYTVAVQPYALPPVGTIDQIAQQEVTGAWGGTSHHFNVTQGGSITVNLSTLNASEQNLARTALGEWTDIIGVTFREVTTGGQIVFDNTEDTAGTPVAQTDANYSRGITSSAHVQISTSWVNRYGTGLYSYSLQTYVHEIGHALGLGHTGNYNGTAEYPYDALFQNDAWSVSVMSYFDPQENTYFGGQGFTVNYALTPMQADIVALQQLYGLSTTTRTGDTTYGYTSNAGGVYDAALYPRASYTIFDSGGNDTLNFSGATVGEVLNLNPETYSSVNGYVGNISIARGVVIENAIGGNGADTIIGNSANNVLTGNGGADTLTGGGGTDIFLDTIAGHNGDRITDFTSGDKIVFSNAVLGSFTYSLSGGVLTYSGGSMTLGGVVTGGTLLASAAATGGVQLSLQSGQVALAHAVANDFNGDGLSDILWRNDAGSIYDFLGKSNGGFVNNGDNSFINIATSWHFVGTGDFNGDKRTDILWRNDSGAVFNVLGTTVGGFANNGDASWKLIDPNWSIVGVGDFNGDGRSDILLANAAGTIVNYLANVSGAFADNSNASVVNLGTSWHVIGTGDFNGDGVDDVLLRNSTGQIFDLLGNTAGGVTNNGGNSFVAIDSGWHFAGTGDFNGDGLTDVLWRNDAGAIFDFLGTANGGFVNNGNVSYANVPTTMQIESIGDFNGDGRADILWQNSGGTVTDWLGTTAGGFVANDANSAVTVGLTWHVQDNFF